ncbi:MAG: RHS repeat-associated core domain-containing protein [Polyangiales bacterium]
MYPDERSLVPFLRIDYASREADPHEGRRHYLFANHLGCIERVVDDAGRTEWRAEPGPYGARRIEAPTGFEQPLRWPGHYQDEETGLHYNRFRYYDPTLGRYVESDPQGLAGGLNLYAYTRNPLVSVDLRGLSDVCPTTGRPIERAADADGADAEGRPRTPGAESSPMDRALPGDDERFQRNAEARASQEPPLRPLSREEWQEMANRIRDNQARGNVAETATLDALDVDNNNRAIDREGNAREIETYPRNAPPDTPSTRPDGVTDRSIIDVKSMPDDGPRVLDDSEQFDLRRRMAEGPPTRQHVVVMTNGDRSAVRPSGPLGEGSTVYHRDSTTGAWSKWNPTTNRWTTIAGPPSL